MLDALFEAGKSKGNPAHFEPRPFSILPCVIRSFLPVVVVRHVERHVFLGRCSKLASKIPDSDGSPRQPGSVAFWKVVSFPRVSLRTSVTPMSRSIGNDNGVL